MTASAAELSARGRVAAHTRWAHETDRTEATAPARRGLMAKFEREVDPEGRLTEAERTRRAESLFNAHMARLSMKAAAARRRKAQT